MFVDLEFDENGTEIQANGHNKFEVPYSRTNSNAPEFYKLTFPVEANEDENLADDSKKVAQLANENLILQKRLDRTSEDLSIARSYLSGTSSLSEPLTDDQSNELLKLDSLSPNNYQHSGFLEVFNIPEFAKILIYDLKPRLALKLPHCLPAQLLLTAFRYFDHTQKDLLISNLFNAVHVILKEISANSRDDFDIQALWLTNVWSLLNLLRQYSGETEEEWTAQNTEKQNALKMQYYNFEPIRNQLKLRVEEFYANVMKHTVEPVLAPKISAGILHHESVSFKVADKRINHGKLSREPSKDATGQSLDDIKEFLSIIHAKLQAFGADYFLISQIFAQIAKWMSSLAMNQLVYRKDLCTFEKSIQIKHNVMEIKGWLEKQKARRMCCGFFGAIGSSCQFDDVTKGQYS
ncbi:Dil domain containing protein [Aphelenchoides bicaudatus]|nr:Dil domain containing protein [Aphelenchoides bicaudatus]